MLNTKDYEKLLEFQSQMYSYDAYDKDIRYAILQSLQTLYKEYPIAFFLTNMDEQYINPVTINFDTSFMDSYNQHYFKTDIFHTVNIQKYFLSKKVIRVTDITSRKDFENTEFYNDVLNKMNTGDEIVLHLHQQNKLLGAIGILKPKELGNFTEKEIEYARMINAHINNLLKKSLINLNLEHQNQILVNFVDKSPIGMILVDNNFDLIGYNQIALSYINEICNQDPENMLSDQVIKTFIEKIYFKGFSPGNFIQTDIKDYAIKIKPFVIPNFSQGITTLYYIYIYRRNNNTINPSILKSKYKLTSRECELVFYLLEGYSNKQIADELFISPHTVKTHMQNIFKKMECVSRSEVIRKTLLIN